MPAHKSKVKATWLSEKDKNGDLFSEYFELIPENYYKVKCTWCTKPVDVSNQGKGQLHQHASTKGHKEIADHKKKRKSGQSYFRVEEVT